MALLFVYINCISSISLIPLGQRLVGVIVRAVI
jgi:hypothetical protein